MRWWKSLSARIATFLALATLVLCPAAAAPITRISVRVELYGVGAISSHVRRALPGHLARELAKHPGDYPPGSRLVLRVTEIFLVNVGSPHGAPGRFGSGLAMPDAMEGEVSVLDARGRVIISRRVSARSSASSGGWGTVGVTEPRRVEALTAAMAYWAVQALN